jgi:hypothetical protein
VCFQHQQIKGESVKNLVTVPIYTCEHIPCGTEVSKDTKYCNNHKEANNVCVTCGRQECVCGRKECVKCGAIIVLDENGKESLTLTHTCKGKFGQDVYICERKGCQQRVNSKDDIFCYRHQKQIIDFTKPERIPCGFKGCSRTTLPHFKFCFNHKDSKPETIKSVKECCHVQSCYMHKQTNASSVCNTKCGGHFCTHWVGCKPPVIITEAPVVVSELKQKKQYREVVTGEKEAPVKNQTNPNARERQQRIDGNLPVLPLYYYDDTVGKYFWRGVVYKAKDLDGIVKFFTDWHCVSDNDGVALLFDKVTNTHKEIQFTFLKGDDCVSSVCPVPMPSGKLALCSKEMKREDFPREVQMMTVDNQDQRKNAVVNCSGSMNDHDEFVHFSDTFNNQCGSPYVSNNIVYYQHHRTDSKSNYGFYKHSILNF